MRLADEDFFAGHRFQPFDVLEDGLECTAQVVPCVLGDFLPSRIHGLLRLGWRRYADDGCRFLAREGRLHGKTTVVDDGCRSLNSVSEKPFSGVLARLLFT